MSEQPMPTVSEDDLLAYVDGRLSTERAADIERWLSENPGDAARVRAWRINDRALGVLHAEVLDAPVPERLNPVAIARRRRRSAFRMAAAVALFALGLQSGWIARDLTGDDVAATDGFTAYAMSAHRVYTNENRHAVEVPAADEKHLVAWLSKRLDYPLLAPDLRPAGFHLVGGRLLPSGRSYAAQFMFEDNSGRRLTLFVSRDKNATPAAFRYESQGNVGAFYWMEGELAYALLGEAGRDELYTLAHTVYDQMAR